jgi:hypothetical protein
MPEATGSLEALDCRPIRAHEVMSIDRWPAIRRVALPNRPWVSIWPKGPPRVERGRVERGRVERGWVERGRVLRGWVERGRVERGWVEGLDHDSRYDRRFSQLMPRITTR